MTRGAALLMLCAAPWLHAWAQAASAPLPDPPPAIAATVPQLTPRGAGSYRWFGLHVYDATLWTPAQAGSLPDWSQPLALRLRYARSLRGADIATRSVDEIARLGLGTPAQQQDWLARMRALFPDVRDGSTLSGVHLPGRGARFFHDDRLLGDIADAEFSRAFFSIWLHAETSAPALREALLGRRP